MIEIEHLSKRFDGPLVVDDVSMSIADGEIVVIVGTSGSGKTTLLRMIRRLIGYAIQGHGLFPHRTVGENIATVPNLIGWPKDKTAARVDELMTLFALDPAQFRDRLPAELSGGQQQRVGVARALAAAPKVLLMDEPFGALDPIIRAKAQSDLKAVQDRLGTTVVLVTHDMNEAIALGDRIAVMDDGKLLQYDTPEHIVVRPATAFVGELLGTGERPFRLLSFRPVREFLEQGPAPGAPIAENTSLLDALEEALWTGRDAVPIANPSGNIVGRVTLATAVKQAARPV